MISWKWFHCIENTTITWALRPRIWADSEEDDHVREKVKN